MAKKIDMRSVNKSLSVNKAFKTGMRQKVIKSFESSKKRLLQEFKAHPVTTEINAGPTSKNTSGTLGGYGNLFTFIGFPFGTKPTDVVERMIRDNITLGEVKKTQAARGRVSVSVRVDVPSKQAFASATPLPFGGGRSWLYGIETGISGFGNYMFKKWKTSRSGRGIETKKKIRGGSFKNTSYFSSMLLAFTKRIR
tara:strand:- start:149 stop:736 length:588 start_codon:yes stop_codon:yes gene_type:complete